MLHAAVVPADGLDCANKVLISGKVGEFIISVTPVWGIYMYKPATFICDQCAILWHWDIQPAKAVKNESIKFLITAILYTYTVGVYTTLA